MQNRNKKRADGRIKVSIYLGMVDGKKKYKYVYGATQAEAERKARDVRKRLLLGERVEAGDQPFQMWAQRLMALKEPDVSPSYFKGLAGRCRWWCERLGEVPISQVRTSDIQDGISALFALSRAKKTLADYRNTAIDIFALAERDRAITYNPARWADIPKSAPKATRFALEPYERQWIEQSEHRAKTAAMIMLYTGVRRGELLALMVKDIDLTARVLRVDKAVYFDGNTPLLKRGGKTAAAARTIPIPDVLASYLRGVLAGRSPMEIIVCDERGKHMTESAFARMWESYLSYLNEQHGQAPGEHKSRFAPGGLPMTIRNITPHTLRHTYATMLHAAGVDVLTAQKFLGHADAKTTLSIYTHLAESTVQSDTKKLDEYLETMEA